ncbi:Nucleoporin nup85, partial [Dinochytrium kinnereticum]
MRAVRDNLQIAFQILAGVEDVIVDSAEGWQEAMVALIVFTNPTVGPEEVGAYLHQVHHLFEDDEGEEEDYEVYMPSASKNSILDKALWALLELDLNTAIMFCTRIDPWLVTHLTDILDKFGRLDIAEGRDPISILSSTAGEEEEEGEEDPTDNDDDDDDIDPPSRAITRQHPLEKRPTLREWYIMEYADPLASHPSLWRVGIEYMTLGGGGTEECLSRIEAHLSRIDPEDGTGLKTRKLLNLTRTLDERWQKKRLAAGRLGLASGLGGVGDQPGWVTKTLNRVVARRRLEAGRLGEALDRYAEAGEAGRAVGVADRVLREHVLAVGIGPLGKAKELLLKGVAEGATSMEGVETSAAAGDTSKPPVSAATLVMEELSPQTAKLSTRIAFLSEYRRYQKLYESERWNEAGQALVGLFSGGLAPKFMWGQLLLDAVPLLEGPPKSRSITGSTKPEKRRKFQPNHNLFAGPPNPTPNGLLPPIDTTGTQELMRCLEELLTGFKAVDHLIDPFPTLPLTVHDDEKRSIDVGGRKIGYGMTTVGTIPHRGARKVNPFLDESVSFPGEDGEVPRYVRDGVGGKERYERLAWWKTELDVVRLSLTRNLARSMCGEMMTRLIGPVALVVAEEDDLAVPLVPVVSVSPFKRAPTTPASTVMSFKDAPSTVASRRGSILFASPRPPTSVSRGLGSGFEFSAPSVERGGGVGSVGGSPLVRGGRVESPLGGRGGRVESPL